MTTVDSFFTLPSFRFQIVVYREQIYYKFTGVLHTSTTSTVTLKEDRSKAVCHRLTVTCDYHDVPVLHKMNAAKMSPR